MNRFVLRALFLGYALCAQTKSSGDVIGEAYNSDDH
jgi:hypothetical protein